MGLKELIRRLPRLKGSVRTSEVTEGVATSGHGEDFIAKSEKILNLRRAIPSPGGTMVIKPVAITFDGKEEHIRLFVRGDGETVQEVAVGVQGTSTNVVISGGTFFVEGERGVREGVSPEDSRVVEHGRRMDKVIRTLSTASKDTP